MENDNTTELSREMFWWFGSMNYRINNGHFDEGVQSVRLHRNVAKAPNMAPLADYANFTSQCTWRYSPPAGSFGVPQTCTAIVWQRTFNYDMQFNDCQIPQDNTYVGTQTVDGVFCDGYHFIAVNYPFDAGNTMWTAREEVDPQRRPVRMIIHHNGRSIVYKDFKIPADTDMLSQPSAFCSDVDHTVC